VVILKQAWNLLLSEPYISFAIIGSVIQLFLEIEGTGTTTLIVSYNYTHNNCLNPTDIKSTCVIHENSRSKEFLSVLGILKVIISVPFMILTGWLCSKMNHAVLLVCCYVITISSGFYMVAFTHEAGSNINFTIAFLIT